MTAQEAIQVLAQVVSQTRATPQEHQMLQEALRTLAPKPERKDDAQPPQN